MKRSKKYCSNLTEATKKNYFRKVTKSGFANNKEFCNTARPFFTDKGFVINDNIARKINDESVTDKKSLADLFNSHYINTPEKNTSDIPPVIQDNPDNKNEDNVTIIAIIR